MRSFRINTQSPIEQQMADVQTAIDQVWQTGTENTEKIVTLQGRFNVDKPLSWLYNLVKGISGHTSAMPDNRGENADHDERYVKKSKYDSKIAELEARITALEP
jgi:hypothetical protein